MGVNISLEDKTDKVYNMCEPLQYSTKGFVWVCSSGGEDVKGAITVEATESETMYVGRASHEDDLVPGKVHKSHNVLYVPWGGDEHAKESYQVLVADANAKYEWISSSSGEIPNGAIQGGHTSSGEPLYIGRIVHDGVLTTGKIHPSHGVVYVPYASKEHGYGCDYEILVAIE